MDNTGKLVTTIVNTLLNQNTEIFKFDMTNIPSGVYMVNISVGKQNVDSEIDHHRIILLELYLKVFNF